MAGWRGNRARTPRSMMFAERTARYEREIGLYFWRWQLCHGFGRDAARDILRQAKVTFPCPPFEP